MGLNAAQRRIISRRLKKEAWKRMEGCRICPTVAAYDLLGVGAGWLGLRPNGFGRLVTRFVTTAVFLAFPPHLTTAN